MVTSPISRYLLPLALISSVIPIQSATPSKPTQAPEKSRLSELYGRLPLAFEANHGQTSSNVRFFARSGGYGIWLTGDGAMIGRPGSQPVRLKWKASRPLDHVQPLEKLPGVANYLIGKDPSGWRTNVPLYARVVYREVYSGVDVAFYGRNGQFEYDFEVAPGADPSAISLVHEGARSSRLTSAGDLVLLTAFGEVTMKKPVAYQMIAGKRREVAVRYQVASEQVRFALAGYDRKSKLVIDPVVVYNYQLAGANAGPAGIAVDSIGAAYIAGLTFSASFPVVSPALQNNSAGGADAFVAKLNSQGNALVYATYIGGSGSDEATSIAVDPTGIAYVAGDTDSPDFPQVSPGQAARGGGKDAFVLKLNAAGSALQYSTYLGGNGIDIATAIAIDALGQAYVTGSTASPNFPTANAFQSTWGGNNDIFVTRFTAAGAISYSTYIGGGQSEVANGIAVDPNNGAYITGTAANGSLPVQNPFSGLTGTANGAFVAKLNSAGSGLEYSSFLGPTYLTGNGIAVDSSGAAYVTGTSPVVGNSGSYLAKITPFGGGFNYSASLRGSTRAVAIDSSGAAYVTSCLVIGNNGLSPIYGLTLEKWNPAGSARMYVQPFLQDTCGTEPGGYGDPVAIDATGAAYLFTGNGGAFKITPVITIPAQLTTQVAPAGCGTISVIPGPDDNSDNYYRSGTSVLLTAFGNNCFFSNWSGDLSGTLNSQVLGLFGSKTVTAVFNQCFFSLNPGGTLNYPYTGSTTTQNVVVNTTLGCSWNISVNVPWITVTSTSAGAGNGVLSFTLAANTATFTRTGQITIGNQNLTINQAGAPVCNYGVSTTTYSFLETGGNGSVGVGALSSCVWTATTTAPWITVNGATGSGIGSVSFTVAPNPGFTRNGILTIAGIDVRINQTGSAQAQGLAFVPITPCRLMETRADYNFEGRTGAFGPPFLRAGETRTLTLASSICPIPATARAYVINVTLIPKTTADFVTVYPGGESRPDFWTVRSPDGQIVANSAIVKSGSGAISVYSSSDADILIDISGAFVDRAASGNLVFYPLTPCRVIDTRSDYRSPAGAFGPPTMNAGQTRRFQFPSTPYCSIPTGAAAYSMTITAVPPASLAYLTAWPAAAARPNVSSINSFAGRTLANSVIVPASSDGSLDVFAYDRTDFLVDINGYFAIDNGNGQYFFPIPQCRAANSTDATLANPFGTPIYNDDTTRTIPLLSSSRCPSIPSSAKAYAVNVTALPGGSPDPFITVYPTGQARPNSSILNAFQGQVVTNAAIVPAGANGAIDVYTYRRSNVVVELSGYFGR